VWSVVSFNTQNPFSGALCERGAGVLVFIYERIIASFRNNVLAPWEWFSPPLKFSLLLLGNFIVSTVNLKLGSNISAVICVQLSTHYDIHLLLQEKSRSADTKMQTKNVNINQASVNNNSLEVSQPLEFPLSSYISIGCRRNLYLMAFTCVWIKSSEILHCIG